MNNFDTTLFLRLGGILIILGALFYFFKKKGKIPGTWNASFGQGRTPTPTLDTYSTDFTRQAHEGNPDPVIGREHEVMRLTQVLSRRTKNNAILIGPPGVGKTAIVEGLAQRIAKGTVPDELKNKRVLALEVASLLSGTKYRGEFEERAKKIVREITSTNRSIILFIDEVHSVIQSQGTEGAINFSDILKPALARGDLQMVGATTIAEYEKYIKSDPSLERRFQPIEVREPNIEETLRVLQGVKDKYREYHRVEFTDASLETAIRLTKEKIAGRKLPDKAIDAIDEAAAMVKVADVHPAIHEILLQSAVEKHPEVAKHWAAIEKIDGEIAKGPAKTKLSTLKKKRETLEAKIREQGILTVDSDDVTRVVMQWLESV